jgi:hypothetical protein
VTTVQIRNKTERVAGISVQRGICFDFADILKIQEFDFFGYSGNKA